jgi:hypothetical protein
MWEPQTAPTSATYGPVRVPARSPGYPGHWTGLATALGAVRIASRQGPGGRQGPPGPPGVAASVGRALRTPAMQRARVGGAGGGGRTRTTPGTVRLAGPGSPMPNSRREGFRIVVGSLRPAPCLPLSVPSLLPWTGQPGRTTPACRSGRLIFMAIKVSRHIHLAGRGGGAAGRRVGRGLGPVPGSRPREAREGCPAWVRLGRRAGLYLGAKA